MKHPGPELPLAADFARATREQWLVLVRKVLAGADFERLASQTADGIKIAPLYARDPVARPIRARMPGAPWQVMQRVDHPDPAAANAEALHDLASGATGLTIVCAGSLNANGYGIDGSAATLARVLEGVTLGAGTTIDFNVSPQTRNIVRHFAALVKSRRIAPEAAEMRASINPIGGLAAAGGSPQTWSNLAPTFAGLVAELSGQGFRGPFAVADGRIVHNAGGSEAQELAFAIASAVTYLRALEAQGIALDAARGMIYFRLSADADQFLTIAKFRAVRKLWARVEEACGLAPRPCSVFAETAWRMMTKRDPWVNMLRTTVATLAAGLGGADAITVLPYTAAIGLPDRFARRIARNTQLVLLEESNLAKVGDPAAGSGSIENLTQMLCGAAWTLFQEIEKVGGAWAALEQGLVQKKIAAVRAEREKAVAHRRDALTGTSEFPDAKETPVAVLDVPTVKLESPGASIVTCEVLPRVRLAEPFERLRDAADAYAARTGAPPRVFVAALGTPADYAALSNWLRNFFAVGGIEAVFAEGLTDAAGAGAAFKASGAPLACICASDAVYAQLGAVSAQELKAAGAARVYAVGRPARVAGVDEFLYAGVDMVEVLGQMQRQIGVRA